MNKNALVLGIIALIIIGLGAVVYIQQNNQRKYTPKSFDLPLDQQKSDRQSINENSRRVRDEQKLQEQPTPQNAGVVANASYTITPSSKIEWEGSKTLLANYVDRGILMVKEGSAVVKDGIITSGEVIFDMNSITALSTGKQQGQDMLSNHLKSDAFFDTTKYPISTFVLKEAVRTGNAQNSFDYTLKGDLTIKGITNPVELPARVYSQSGEVHVDAVVTLDRTKWDIRFGSGKFFKDLADNVIDDMFTVTFSLNAYQMKEIPVNQAQETPPGGIPLPKR